MVKHRFSMKELVARVRAASRRGVRPQEAESGETIEIEELRIDQLDAQALVDGESADLTPTEFRLLYALALEQGRVVGRDELLQKLWGRREGHRDQTSTSSSASSATRSTAARRGTRSSRHATASAISSRQKQRGRCRTSRGYETRSLRQELDALQSSLFEEGDLVRRALRGAVEALEQRDPELANGVIEFDDEVDRRSSR